MSMTTGPIADLSYRNYDGELSAPRYRWWVIARSGIRLAMEKKSMWVIAAISGWYYLAMIFILFIRDQMSSLAPPGRATPISTFLQNIVWKDQFVHGFSYGQILFLILALMLGAGSIANDNRSNALLVYLSKPCNKRDYLFGKWFGIFLPLLIVSAIPSLVFYMYGLMSYRDHGFLSDPWIIVKLFTVLPIGAAFYASLAIGFSSMFSQGRVAGAALAGFYFLPNFFTTIIVGIWVDMNSHWHRHSPSQDMAGLVAKLFYASVDGLNIGMAKGIFATNGSPYFGLPTTTPMVPAPSLVGTLGIMATISLLCIMIAWRRLKPVEVVG